MNYGPPVEPVYNSRLLYQQPKLKPQTVNNRFFAEKAFDFSTLVSFVFICLNGTMDGMVRKSKPLE